MSGTGPERERDVAAWPAANIPPDASAPSGADTLCDAPTPGDADEEALPPPLDWRSPSMIFEQHWRFIVFVLLMLTMGLRTGDGIHSGFTVFALLLVVWVPLMRHAERRGWLERYRCSLIWGRSFLMWRTDHGKRSIEWLARRRALWNRLGDFGLVMVFGSMILMFLLLAWQATIVSDIPKSSAVSPKMMVGLPGLNPVIPLWYGILALLVAMVVHEGCHGILGRVAGIKLKALGLLFFIVPIGAFVEPDEDEMKAMPRRQRMRLYAAGPASNIVVAVMFAILFSWGTVASLEPAHEGVLVANVVKGYGAHDAGLEPWMLVTMVNGTPVQSDDDFSDAVNRTWAGQNITVVALDNGVERAFTNVTLGDKGGFYLQYYPDYYEPWMSGKGFIGMGVVDQEAQVDGLVHPLGSAEQLLRYMTLPFMKLQPFPDQFTALFEPTGLPGMLPDDIFWILANCLYWIFWLNLMVGLTNALPAVPLDGGFIFADSLEAGLNRFRHTPLSAERREIIVDRVVTALALTVVALLLWQLVGPRLIGTDVGALQAHASVDTDEEWNGYIFSFDTDDSEGDFVTYAWDFGDGNLSEGERVNHSYAVGGIYYVVLTASDADNRKSRAFTTVTVHHRESEGGSVAALGSATETVEVAPLGREVRCHVVLTDGASIVDSSATLTLRAPDGREWQEAVLVPDSGTEEVEFVQSGSVGGWELSLESNDFAFDYQVEWEVHYRVEQ